jgi:hypothetical protein
LSSGRATSPDAEGTIVVAGLIPTFSERVAMTPGLVERDPVLRQRGFVLLLFDAFTKRNRVEGTYSSHAAERADQEYADRTGDPTPLRARTTVRLAGRALVPFRKDASAFVFFADLPPGPHVVEVRSPYYVPRDVTVTLPFPDAGWPAFPDVTLANEDLPLGSPLQPAAYRTQREAATLVPAPGYPFPPDATLVRGTVRSGGLPLAGAAVRRAGDPLAYVTERSGDYVLFFDDVPGVGAAVTVQATHPLHAPVSTTVQALRGTTVLRDISMA